MASPLSQFSTAGMTPAQAATKTASLAKQALAKASQVAPLEESAYKQDHSAPPVDSNFIDYEG